jgi:hypothetical protein
MQDHDGISDVEMIGAMFQEMSMTKPPKKQVSDDGHYSTVMYV